MRTETSRILWRLVISLGSFAVVLTGTIVLVSQLSSLDRITLSGGIATFASVLSAWIVVTTILWVRWWKTRAAVSPATSPTVA